MADFPSSAYHLPTISSISPEAVGASWLSGNGGNTYNSVAWPAANRGIFVPFSLHAPYWCRMVWWANGATANGNIDCGVYAVGTSHLLSAGSTAQAGTTSVQSVVLGTPVLLMPGSYYMALSASATTVTMRASNSSLQNQIGVGMAQQATVLPLPTTVFAPATMANAYLPLFGISSRTLI